MTATDDRQRFGATFTTAALLAGAALVVGQNNSGTRAGVVAVLAVLAATVVFARNARAGKLPRTLLATPALLLMVIMAGLAALSVGWSLLPEASMHDALRIVSYTAVLALAALAAQMRPQNARAVALGVALAALIVSLYALGSRCFPGLYPAGDDYARLRLPFGYWNAVGSAAAIGLMLTLWANSRREVSRAVEIATYPAGGLMFATLMLSGSRGAILALGTGAACWFLIVPLRLRGGGYLAIVGAVAGLLVAWAYSRPALTTDNLPLADREAVGWKLLLALIAMTCVLTALGALVRRRRLKRPLTDPQRRNAGRLLLAAVVIVPLLFVTLGTDRGLGTLGDAVRGVTSESGAAPSNAPSRLTSANSLRGRYWSESRKIFSAHPLHGTGADTFLVARMPFRKASETAAHAHGMVPQTASDLGVLGLIVLLGLALTWLVAVGRLAGAAWSAPWRWLPRPDADRLASLALAAGALVFGVDSAIDWIWFVPGVAYFGLVCGGWVLGTPAAHPAWLTEGEPPAAEASGRTHNLRAAAIAVVGLLIAYGVYLPVRASQKINSGLHVAQSEPKKALKLGHEALSLDPTSAGAQMLIATAQNNSGHPQAAERTLLHLARTQPGNPEAWMRLAQFRLTELDDPDGAIDALRPIFYTTNFYMAAYNLAGAARRAKAYNALEKIARARKKELERQLDQLQQLRNRAPNGQPPRT